MKKLIDQATGTRLSRRRFVEGVVMGGTLLGYNSTGLATSATAANLASTTPSRIGNPDVITSTTPRLIIGHAPVNFTGKQRIATTVNGGVPAPVLRWKQGQELHIAVKNQLAHDTSIHWHGLILPSAMDGVPGISDGFKGIPPGETFHYRFPLLQSGTYWYHSHSGFQEQVGLYGAIVIDPAGSDPVSYDRDYVILLSDWSDEDPDDLFANLKKMPAYYNFNERTMQDLMRDIQRDGVQRTWAQRQMWNQMRMSDRDISDVTGHTYTFLMNGQTPAEGWKALFKSGERVRLRIINGSAMTFFDVRIPGLDLKVVSTDGQDIEPVTVEEIRLGVAETYDVVVEPKDDTAYTIFAQAIDRTGYARGTLTPDLAMTAEVPKLEQHPVLTHGDMGMSMAGMDHGAMGHDMGGMSSDAMSGGDHAGMDHSKMTGGKKEAAKMDSGMTDHSKMNHGGMKKGGMDHSQHGGMKKMASMAMGSGPAGYGSSIAQVHVKTEFGPHMDMRADASQYQLDDPGVGLRNNGRKVLTYSQLANLYPTPDPREPGREINLHLTGNMSRYMWSINGIKFADAEPLILKYGERVRINLLNDTMMNHPIHLHGMWSDLETGEPGRIPRKHTVIVQPGAKISYLVTADAMGGWAYHCHLMYHMMGMFRKVEVVA